MFLTEVGSALKPARDANQVFMSQDQGKTWIPLRDFAANQVLNNLLVSSSIINYICYILLRLIFIYPASFDN